MLEADRGFVSLGAWLRGASPAGGGVAIDHAVSLDAPAPPCHASPAAAPCDAPALAAPCDASASAAGESDAAVAAARDARLFRARLADAFEAACAALVRDFVFAVLGRELLLAPADVATIAARVLAEHPLAPCVRLRVAPADLAGVRADLPVEADGALAPGDVVLELAAGGIDARLGVRLAAVLAAWS